MLQVGCWVLGVEGLRGFLKRTYLVKEAAWGAFKRVVDNDNGALTLNTPELFVDIALLVFRVEKLAAKRVHHQQIQVL